MRFNLKSSYQGKILLCLKNNNNKKKHKQIKFQQKKKCFGFTKYIIKV